MKKILATLVVGLALTTVAFAQPTINIVPPEGDAACTDENICVDVVVANFTDILATRFFIQWDSTVLQFNNTQAYNLPNLGPGNFTQVNNGRVLVDWMALNGNCSDPTAQGVTTADGMVIFQVCFTVLGNYGDATDIIIPATASPITPDIKRKGAGCTNIGIEDSEIDTALVSSCVRPFIIDISDEQGNEGDLVCIDFRVFGMDALTSFQFPIIWDASKATYDNILIPQNLPNLGISSFGVPGQAAGVLPGSVTVSWNAPVPQNGISLPDSTLIFQLCLRLKDGSCNMIFPVVIGDQQPGQSFFTPQASNDFQSGFNDIAVGQFAGEITVGPCNPTGVQLSADCGTADTLNSQICIPVLAGGNFQNVTDLAFLIEWNPNILSFTNTQSVGLPGGITFNTANASNGILGMQWDGNPTNRNDGDVLFEVCFDITGLGGNSPFTFINNEDDLAQVNNGPNIGINPTNCEKEVIQPEGVIIDITDDLQGRPGDTLCFDFSVFNFTDVESMQFSLAFEPNYIEFILAGGIQNLTLPGATIANFGLLSTGAGQITFNWTAPSPLTLPPGESIFTLCFRIPDDATPGICDLLQVADVPIEAEVITSSSNGENIGIYDSDSRYCILSPEGFYLEIGSVTGEIQDTVCLPVKVSEFTDITGGDFTINWSPGSLALIEVNDPGVIPGLNIGLGGQPVGNADFDFSAPGGLSLPDSTVIFEMCFELLGPADSCYVVAVQDNPLAVVTTVNGPGSLLDSPGEACIKDRLFLVDTTIIPESCPGAGDGSARVVVEGGQGPYIYSWQTQPPQFLDSARFLSEGFVIVTILDQSAPPLKITDTLYIPALGADLFVNAGPDKVSSCDPPCTFISPQASQGPEIMYTWTASQGGQVCSNPNSRTLLGRGPGKFVIEVKDINTGCSVTDEVLLTPAEFPDAEAGDALSLTCVRDEVTLNASGSSQGDSIQYTWRDPMNNIIAGPSNAASTAIGQDTGFYYLEVEIATTGCVAVDSVEVVRDTIAPTAVASPGTDTTFLGCNEMATLTGFAGDVTQGLSYAWVDSNGDTLTTDSVYMTNQLGTYTFQVLNEVNGCFNSDNTVVVTDSAVAVVEILGNPTVDFTCNDQNVILRGVVTNVPPDAFSYEWIASNGAAIAPGTETSLTPEITSPGTLELVVTSDQTGCVSSASAEVGTNTDPPLIDVSAPDSLTCIQESILLDASGSAQGGPYRYVWRNVDLNVQVNNNNEPTATVALEGTYIFTLLDTVSGCSAADTIMVVRDTLPPSFSAGFPNDLTCLNETTEVRTLVDLPFGTYTIQWTATDGGSIQSGATDTLTVFDAGGAYLLEVTDLSSGCSGTLERIVEAFQDQPTAEITNSMVNITCTNDLDTIDASASTMNDTLITVTYQWNALQGTIAGDLTRNFLPVDAPGIYELIVTNVNSQCVDRDTAYVFDLREDPVAEAGPNLTLACSNTDGMLDGSESTQGDNIAYYWTNEAGDTVGTNVMLPVTLPGLYRIRVVNTDNGCFATDLAIVAADGEPAEIVFEAPTNAGLLDLDCTMDTISVSFRINNDTIVDVNNLVFEWDGDIQTTADPFTVQVYTGGTFTLTATDTTSGCVGTNELVVTDLRDLPVIAAESSGDINCLQNTVMLSGDGSAAGDTIQYQWLDPNGMEISAGLQATANMPGTYQFMVTNTSNSCTATEAIEVAEDIDPPAIIFDTNDTSFQCRDASLLLSAAPSGLPGNFSSVSWSTINGGVATAIENTLTASVNGPGLYQLTLVSSANGCDSTATISIAADTLAPNIAIAEPPLVGCPGQSVSLDASQSGSPSDFESISWSTASGSGTPVPAAGSLVVDVDDAGTYIVTLVSADNGCEATQEVVVDLDPNAPVAEATASNTVVGCGESVTLDGSQSSQGAIYDYQWLSLSGGVATPNPGDETMASVTVAGVYQLVVVNTQTMCTDTSAALELALDPSLVAAAASQDAAACGDGAPVSGNAGALPANTTGRWTSLSGAIIADEASPSTSVSSLVDGENILVWSLSQDGCPDYSSDTLVVIPEKAPEAQADLLSIPLGENSGTLNVVANDQLLGVSDWTVSVLTDPTLGRVTDEGDGDLTYALSISLLSPATDEFTYELCNALCPELCSEAIVEIEVERDTTGKFDVPNGITPNGDGLNDAFVFDQLLLNPDKFPDNELIIFNRWGDIVYTAKPYLNNWQGTTTNGDELPDGTYYYVLRLNIGEGEIIRGDITVIKAPR
ncbi:MAG: gliding motility-associated C-terminal domain-containing protein [Lewinellaceae bacterium]|nr:gliding motility-associated C-terminal domain-containing protein [Phaeodactylibacter sp.]MCB9351621.1 gliding motility-associated C-terminal domain-containing protein [Lewinellaceae bacterium]